jgi:hypothetical protein
VLLQDSFEESDFGDEVRPTVLLSSRGMREGLNVCRIDAGSVRGI